MPAPFFYAIIPEMPLTPYHLGPASALGISFRKTLNIPALLVSSVILDVEPFIVLVLDLDRQLHGLTHNFLVGSGIALATAIMIYFFLNEIKPIMALFKLDQDYTFRKIFLSSLIGVYSHVIMDSFLYSDMKPFFPSAFNPIFYRIGMRPIILFCLAGFVMAATVYFVNLILGTGKIVVEKEKGDGHEQRDSQDRAN